MHKAIKICGNKRVRTVTNGAHGVKGTKTTVLQISKQRHDALQRRLETMKTVNAMLVEHGAAPDELTWGDYTMGDGAWVDEDDEFGEVDASHEGGEYGDLVREALSQASATRQHQDMRAAVKTRKERYRAIRLNWDAQMDTLVAAYLAWKHEAAAPTSPPEDPPPTPPAQPVLTTENQPVPADVIGQTNPTHRFDVVAIWTHVRNPSFVVEQGDISTRSSCIIVYAAATLALAFSQ
ncbi:hypothetical protein EW026_g8427 [Hermanssonia centrifuga]|uniref:Uncharacterized protein n=1 Tax=Hermanssonia centrifuga TaxID=98765 RepID=A0A4S4K451_9APHY|nr:hypothetical protein EW026_g8427 [Hermanssonia centrifuga]